MTDQSSEHGPDLMQGVALSQLQEGVPFLGTVEDDPVVVVKRNDELYAIGARCTHYGGPLEDGLVVGETIRCPWHHAAFDLTSGEAVGAPAFGSTGCYPIEIDGFHFRVLPKESADEAPAVQGPDPVVIVGAGAAAAAACEALRQAGYTGSITMIGAESSGPVDRPNLSKDFLAGNAPKEWIPLGGDAHWEELDVELVVSDPVVAIDRREQKVQTESGKSFSYERLLYATGAEPVLPPMGGLESTQHFTLRSFGDTKRIVEAAEEGENALIVGASFIGLEVAASLRKRGLGVTVVAPEAVPLARVFGEEVGRLVQSVHEEQGVRFEMGAKVENLVDGIARMTNSSEVPFDFVVLGVGVRPRTRLAEGAGLDVDDGVVVDEELKSSDDHIYAAGDVARYPDHLSGRSTRVEHWVLAQRQGQAAARNMLRDSGEPFTDIPFFWSRHFNLNVHYIGNAPEFDEIAVNGSVADQDATIGYLQNGEVLAVATIGRSLDGLRAEWALADGDQKRLRELVGA